MKVKNIAKKGFLMLLSFMTAFSLASCNEYKSSYKAKGFIKQQLREHCQAEFDSLQGMYVFKIYKLSDCDGTISYSASLEEGELCVYFDSLGSKETLFTLKAGESVEDCGGYYGASPVFIILETSGAKGGSVYIDLI